MNNNLYKKDYSRYTKSTSNISQVSFFNKVFALMSGGLILSAITAYFTATTPAVMQVILAPGTSILLVLATLGLVMAISFGINKFDVTTLVIMFIAYSFLNGMMLSSIFIVYKLGVIYQAFFSAAGMFAAMSFYGFTTKKDLSGLGSILFMAVIGIVIASVINIFTKSSAFDLIISFAGVVVFALLTAYDVQKLKVLESNVSGTEAINRISIMGALTLYIDFINMFLFLLRLFGSNRD